MGYVYFLRETLNNTVKIGKTKNVANRIGQWTSSLPFDVHEEFVIKTPFHNELERLFHKIFEHKKVKGEWFSLTDDDLYAIKNKLFGRLLIDTNEKESTLSLLHVYIPKTEITERDKTIRVNVSLDPEIHNKLKVEAIMRDMTKTTFGAEIIKTVLDDEKILNQVITKLCS